MGLRQSRPFSYLAVFTVLALMVWAEVVLDRLPGRFTFLAFAPAVVLAAWLISLLPALQRERDARTAAERAAAQAHRLAQSTAAVAHVRTAADAIEAVVQEALHWLEADTATFFLASEDGRQLRVARAVGSGRETGATIDVDLSDLSPLAESIRRLAPAFSPSNEHRGARTAILPLIVDRKAVGLLQLDYMSSHVFSNDDHEYIHTLCSRAAQALSRTWWYEAVDRARVDAESLRQRADAELIERQRTEQALRASETRYRALATRTTRLHALTAKLSVAASVKAVADAIVDQAGLVVGAGDGRLTLVDDGHSSFESGLCSTEAVQTRQPVFVGSINESQEKYWRFAAEAADRGFASTAALPLIVNNAPIGVLEFHFSAPVNFDEEYQALLISVAQHCAQALDRARLYEQATRARADAEEANRLKDDFVSTVSHELRTPLNAILGWAAMLRTGSIDPDVVPQAVDSIHRNASRQAKLVDDLLDFARMAGGRMSLDLENIDATALVRGIVESVIPLAASNQIEIQLSDIPKARLRGDVRRLEQVFVNLLGNALKFTPAGGHIIVSGRVAGPSLEIRVADDGIGIEPEFLPYAFDRFRQGDSTTTRNHSGLGLGLSIAKQLVEAHKGTIRVESAGNGKGTAFTVSLPMDGPPQEPAAATAPNSAGSLVAPRSQM
jgi:signal transduction histidine kinase